MFQKWYTLFSNEGLTMLPYPSRYHTFQIQWQNDLRLDFHWILIHTLLFSNRQALSLLLSKLSFKGLMEVVFKPCLVNGAKTTLQIYPNQFWQTWSVQMQMLAREALTLHLTASRTKELITNWYSTFRDLEESSSNSISNSFFHFRKECSISLKIKWVILSSWRHSAESFSEVLWDRQLQLMQWVVSLL